MLFSPSSTYIDLQRPWMLSIGEYCKITRGVTILTHDYSRSVIRKFSSEIIPEDGKTIIGNNVFIGAGSVVRGNIPSNCIVAGNPARVICTLEEYIEKRRSKYINEAKEFAVTFMKKYNRWPNIEELGIFALLFIDRNEDSIKKFNINLKWSADEEDEILESFLKSDKKFSSYNDFIDFCSKEN